jgi:hypothetical protein
VVILVLDFIFLLLWFKALNYVHFNILVFVGFLMFTSPRGGFIMAYVGSFNV